MVKLVLRLHQSGPVPGVQRRFYLKLDFLRLVEVIVGQPRKIFSAHLPDTQIQRRCYTAVFLLKIADFLSITQGKLRSSAPVVGAVVHNQDLTVWVCLPQGAVYGLRQIVGAVINRYHNGNQRIICPHSCNTPPKTAP